MPIALTHEISPRIGECELTHLERVSIDVDLAVRQHAVYRALLVECGFEVIELSVNRDYPDSTFIEDTAVVVEEIAVLCRMGAPSRRGEVKGVEPVLGRYRPLARIAAPGTLEGGDVLRVGRRLFAGLSPRTNREGIDQLARILAPFGYTVDAVPLRDCLHLKSAVTALDGETVLCNPAWLDTASLHSYRRIEVDPGEPWAANVIAAGPSILMAEGFPGTRKRIEAAGAFEVRTCQISELMKAEAAMTCSSILFTSPGIT